MNIRVLCNSLWLLIGVALLVAGCGGSGSISPGSPALPPTVSATSPAKGSSGVPQSRRISATFDTVMAAATLNSSSFTASTPAGPLSGTVSYVGNTATLLLNSPTPANTVVTATVTVQAQSQGGTPLAANYVWTFTTGTGIDSVAPTVSSIDPAASATGVPLNQQITVVFSKPMLASTLDNSTFIIQGPGGPISGTVTLLNDTAIFKPATSLTSNTTYTCTVTTGVQDLSANALAANKVWTFTTGTSSNLTAPTVVSTAPAASATNVPINDNVSVTFSNPMDVTTLNSGTLVLKTVIGTVVPTTISYANKIVVLNPTGQLLPNSVYTASISTGVRNTSGVPLATATSWSFTTANSADLTRPTVLSTNPADTANNVFLNQSVNATFSKAMLGSSLNTGSFSVAGVSGTVKYDTANNIATFTPSANLLPNTTYTATLGMGATDLAGNSLLTPKVWSFTTGIQTSQRIITLGAASNYAVLAGSTVTNAGPTILNGDLGVSPGTSVTGFPPGLVNGAIHMGDAVAAAAKVDLLAAQLDAAGRLGAVTLAGDLSGLTLTPGLYKNSSSVMLSAGSVTFDAQGDVNAVFILQVGSTLTTSPGTQVILAGGAQAANIYWSVGTSATLGVNSIFKGIILSEASITVNTGAVTEGTLLTKTGAVTLQANTVTRGLAKH